MYMHACMFHAYMTRAIMYACMFVYLNRVKHLHCCGIAGAVFNLLSGV